MFPEECDTCEHCTVKTRYEDYGDVGMPECGKLHLWLDCFEKPPCGKPPKPSMTGEEA